MTGNIDESKNHYFGKRRLCVTGERASEDDAPKVDPVALRVGTNGFIPLWAPGTVLHYRFNERSLRRSGRSKEQILMLFNKALSQWGDAVPVMFTENRITWDFEFVVRQHDDCDSNGCVLASAFFPGGGQQQLVVYPKMLDDPDVDEQVETMAHELGHVFGLRHWFAPCEDMGRNWRAELFGTNNPFTIMNYDDECVMTDIDRKDLKLLYEMAWSGALTKINSTPIVLFKPFSAHDPLRNKVNGL
ncbi:hypothetical protein BG006_004053 [Podila minutissima]|uniref:Peptidase metallopeptidase domain-containing protein n=1 Tax=Podila minutissima TaxID=64525 RepID=A0A9P5VN15_9FUNG|nr:hypothetical protein BG006_004053 [Podila minutissima]